jgi:pimeloyl-ACP methyl ester carboxylesterase
MPNSRRQWLGRQLWGWCSLATLGSGCALVVPPTLSRMEVLRLPGRCGGRSPTLVVMLPGAYSRPPEFVEAGFPQTLSAAGFDADICIADSHVGYYSDRSILRHLREEIVLPARAQGYRQIWLVGISLGGFGALGYAVRHGAEIDGVLAIAPYLGPRRLTQEIVAAGGPHAWRAAGLAAAAPGNPADELDRELWRAFTTPGNSAGPGSAPRPPVYLGYGVDDRFADAHRRFAELLPAAHVATAPGGHDWPAWRALWSAWVARGLLTTGCETA